MKPIEYEVSSGVWYRVNKLLPIFPELKERIHRRTWTNLEYKINGQIADQIYKQLKENHDE